MGREQIRKRRQNQYDVLRALHFGGSMRRGEIGTQFGIRKSSITSIVAELLDVGIIHEETPGNTRSLIALDNNHFHAVVAVVTPDALRLARVYLDGHASDVRTESLADGNSPNLVVGGLVAGLREMCAENVGHPVGIGVAMPGVVAPDTGMCRQASNLSGWQDVPLGSLLAERLNNEVLVDNDVRCQLWDCTWFDRLARDTETLVYVNIAEGVACAVVTHGLPIVGERCSAGEIGHVRAGDEGRVCACGRRDCLETYCSLPAIIRELTTVVPGLSVATAADIAAAATKNEAVLPILDRVTHRLARTIAGVVAAIDPLYLVLGTGDVAFSECLQPLLQRHLFSELLGLNVGHAEIRIADSVANGTMKGIAGRVIERAFRTGRLKLRKIT